ncbi:MAG TPA: DUF4276 family protein [Thermoanaerobaculia bacterium]|jgi:hypothetical protein
MSPAILPIVEGHSEAEAAPVLLRRLLVRLGRPEIQIARPFRVSRLKMVRPGEIERAIIQGIRDRHDIGAILVILDADDDEPLRLEASLLERCRKASHLPSAVVVACREFEAWFLGSKDSLRGVCGIRQTANAPDGPEGIRDAKVRLTKNMDGRGYIEVDDQPVLAARMDLELALRRCVSFQRLVSELERILAASF